MKLTIKKSASLDDLIIGCRKNKSGAQQEMYEKYNGRMLAICRRYIGNIGDAEDTMIKGFMKIFEKIGQFKGEGSFEGWMSRIMVNESLTFIRRSKNMWIESSVDMIDVEPDYNWVDHAIQAEQILQLIDEMPTGYKTVFNLYAIEGYSHREISTLLGISEGSSKSQLSRARAHLKLRLKEMKSTLKEQQDEK